MFKTLTPIFALIIAAGLGFTYVQPTLVDIKRLQTEEKEYQNTIEKASKLKESIDKKKAEINAFDAISVSRLLTMIPDAVDPVLVVMNLDNLASEYRLSLSNITIKELEESGGGAAATPEELVDPEGGESSVSEKAPVIEKEIGFTLTGTYEDFTEFLGSLEKSLEFFEVVNLEFSKEEGDLFDFDITLHTYTFNPEK
ncbi:hypothetical protein K2X96_03715 [Patescibacteria group bacterium]|nr:hypothetical protein [Patescibacteria group bacterium]